MNSLSAQIRDYARKSDPEATFSGEELWNLEIDSAYLDYTWDWGGYRDCRAFTSVFPSPRVNCCISSSAPAVKKAFADNLYLNVFPRKKESVNGSDYISNYPELSSALKQCAKLRKQFLRYFTEGTMIGECILSEPCPGVHVTAYVLPDRVLIVLLNEGGARSLAFDCDLGPWLESTSGGYKAVFFEEDGRKGESADLPSAQWHGETESLESWEISLCEFTPIRQAAVRKASRTANTSDLPGFRHLL